MAEIGFRYRPGAQADLEAHAATIALMCQDLADIPPHLLDNAAKEWARTFKFMPKASELIDLARRKVSADTKGTDFGSQQLQDHANMLNRTIPDDDHWVVAGKAPNRFVTRVSELPKHAA